MEADSGELISKAKSETEFRPITMEIPCFCAIKPYVRNPHTLQWDPEGQVFLREGRMTRLMERFGDSQS